MLLTLFACAERRADTPAPVDEPVLAEVSEDNAPTATPVAAPATLPAGKRGGEAQPSLDAPEAPGGTVAVRDLLLARHTEDVPGRATLEQHAGALEALAWLARYDGELMVRERALLALAQWAGDPTAAQACGAVLSDTSAPAGARAAAAECLGNQDLRGDAALRDLVVAALSDDEGRVGAAAAMALAGVQDARPALEAAAANEALPEETRAAASRALKYRR
ncbi:MAG: hypothetical protein H6741_28910 [Alphaproteobacteria bacterium]|nr:hypothetical protein [Alphaproteobacteria bacterium]